MMNSPAPSHLTSAPFKEKPRRQQSSSWKDVVPPCAARDTSSSWRSTLLPACLAGEPLEGGQPWCRALPNVFKPPCLPSLTLVKSLVGPPGFAGSGCSPLLASPGWAVPLQASSTVHAILSPIPIPSKPLEGFPDAL